MNRVYVGNFPYNACEDDLKDTFSSCGDISNIIITQDTETGRSRGFGFITFTTESGAYEAIRRLNGQSMGGRSLIVSLAEDKRFGGKSQTSYRSPQFIETRPSNSSTQRVRTIEFNTSSLPGSSRKYGERSFDSHLKPDQRRQRRQNNHGFGQS